MVRRVVVIGAGAAGLAVLHRFSANNDIFEIVCFEKLSNVAGLWNYCDNITDPNHPTGSQYTAIYKKMITNAPKQLMMFEDLSFPDHLPSFISHVDVLKYLEKYADEFQLRQYIRFNKRVLNIHPKTIIGREDVWTVKVEDVNTKIEEEFQFDIVIVCNGQYSVPYFPKIKGMDVFKGQVIHSQRYRDPEEFRGKNVLVVGGGPSGIDISIEIATCAAKTWLCQRYNQRVSVSKNVCQVGEIVSLTTDSALVKKILSDDDETLSDVFINSKDQIGPNEWANFSLNKFNDISLWGTRNDHVIGPLDVIVFCTGFYYSYPYFSADCGIGVSSQNNVGPLYKDLICANRPNLSIVGLYHAIVPFSLFDCQAQFLKVFYEGIIPFPSKEEMKEEIKEFNRLKQEHGVDIKKDPFKVTEFQWFYRNHLATIGNFHKTPYYIEDLFKKVWNGRFSNLVNYKNIEYKMGEDGLYVDA